MISAPCARLTIFSTPQTSPMPRPISPYSPPSRIPLTRIWPKSCTEPPFVNSRSEVPPDKAAGDERSPLRPGRDRVARLAEEVLGEDRRHLAVLDLDHGLRQRDLAVRLELDVSVEALEVDLGDLVADLLRIERAGSSARLGER